MSRLTKETRERLKSGTPGAWDVDDAIRALDAAEPREKELERELGNAKAAEKSARLSAEHRDALLAVTREALRWLIPYVDDEHPNFPEEGRKVLAHAKEFSGEPKLWKLRAALAKEPDHG